MRRFACVLALAALCIGLPAAQSRAGNGWQRRRAAAAGGTAAAGMAAAGMAEPTSWSASDRARLGLGWTGLGLGSRLGLGLWPGLGYGARRPCPAYPPIRRP